MVSKLDFTLFLKRERMSPDKTKQLLDGFTVAELAQLLSVQTCTVSSWKKRGMPRYRYEQLRQYKRDLPAFA